jgi:hypothetical protein
MKEGIVEWSSQQSAEYRRILSYLEEFLIGPQPMRKIRPHIVLVGPTQATH